MLRSAPLQNLLARLACLAVVLMLCAPLLSRALQSHGTAARFAELCTTQGLQRVALDATLPMSHDLHAAMPGMSAIDKGGTHADMAGHDGAACDYCLLAIRLLPLLAIVLGLLPLARGVATRLDVAVPRHREHGWPAHPARGPPLAA